MPSIRNSFHAALSRADFRAKALGLEKRAGMYPAQLALEHVPVAK